VKGTIIRCLQEMVEEKFGREAWAGIMQEVGYNAKRIWVASHDLADDEAIKIFQTACHRLGLSLEQAADAFGEYWVGAYAPRIYRSVYSKYRDAKSFILGMNDVHRQATAWLVNSRPPRFDYDWQDERTLLVTYHSHRGLIDIMIGLIRGVAKFFNEPITVTRVDAEHARVVFP